MRTKTFTIYEFDELEKSARARAISEVLNRADEDYSDEVRSIKAIGDIVGSVDIEQDAWDNFHIEFRADIDEDVEGLVNIRLMKWIYNNWIYPNMKGEHFGKLVVCEKSAEHPMGYRHIKRYSKTKRVWDCPLTGFCMDMCLYETYRFMEQTTRMGRRWTMEDFLEELSGACQRELNGVAEYHKSEEYAKEIIESNGYEFYANGALYIA